MARIETLFATKLYRASLGAPKLARFNTDLAHTCRAIAADDRAGQRWSREHDYVGYTSYASLNDLPLRASIFGELERHLSRHVRSYSKELDFDLGSTRLALDSLWINILGPGGVHSGHIHPHSVISGTYYVSIPEGASALKLEDPRLGLMMSAPPRKSSARRENVNFVAITPTAGTVLLWESWLRHEVPRNAAKQDRISISFNYAWR